MAITIDTLKEKAAKIVDVGSSIAVLNWEQETYMPAGGAMARAEQIGTLSEIIHNLQTAPELGEIIASLEAQANQWEYDSLEASMVRNWRIGYDRMTKVPTALASETARVTSLAQQAWVGARKEKNYAAFKPYLEQILALKKQYADCFAPYENVYDVLLYDYERGITTKDVQGMFDSIKDDLIALVHGIAENQARTSPEVLTRHYDKQGQQKLSQLVAEKIGYDFNRGRLDEVAHPFCTTFSVNDVRITTRYIDNWLSSALFGTIHEAGHALYEMGSAQELERTGLAGGTSLGIHESQSRMWENLVGRSRNFWRWAYPIAQGIFPENLGSVSMDEFYRAVNHVQPSFIRVEADEVTYNMHILVRFELEQALMNGQLSLNDLPAAWNDKYKAYLGITPQDDGEGVLQDVHWSAGLMGYFPTYSIGNLLSRQFYDCALREMPDLEQDYERGEFGRLLNWLRVNIHQHGSKFTAKEIIERVTGGGLDARPYMRYLQNKFGEIYGL